MVGFENNLAQMIMMIRQCVPNKNNVKGQGSNETGLCPANYFVMPGGILKNKLA